MKPAKWLLLIVLLAVTAPQSEAQQAKHARWSYSLKKDKTKEYQLVFHLELDRGWYVANQDVNIKKPVMSPAFAFDENKALELKGSIQQKGIIEVLKTDSAGTFDAYCCKVLYTQSLAARSGTKIKGRYTYQLCNSDGCQPPVTERFGFIMK